MKAKKVTSILRKCKDPELSYSHLSVPQPGKYANAVELRVGPLPFTSPGGIEHALAVKIAAKYGIDFKDYDFNRGTDEPPLYKPIFSANCLKEDEIERTIKRIIEARDELKAKFENLAEVAMKSA
jgi:hypothetical protein